MRSKPTDHTNESWADSGLARNPRRSALVATISVVLIDQISKAVAVAWLQSGSVNLVGSVQFRLVANRGAFMGTPAPGWLLLGVTAALVIMVARSISDTTAVRAIVGYSLLLGGALGNLVDRIQHRDRFPTHAVVDWISTRSLPTFNLADAAIFAGLMVSITNTKSDRRSAAAEDDNHIDQHKQGDNE